LLGFKGYSHLQDRRYNEVVFATSHNAQSNLPPTKDTLIPVQNQVASITDQLNGGIRAMKVPIFWQDETVIATHGVNEGVKGQVKKLVDTKLDELITQKVDAAIKNNKEKIVIAQKVFDNAKSQLNSLSKRTEKKYGRSVTVSITPPQWAKDAVNTAENTLNTLKNDQTTLGLTIKNEITKDAENVLGAFISKKVLNIYYHPELVKPSDLDPAGRPLVNILREVKTFMNKNPQEIITIFLEVYGDLVDDPGKVLNAFTTAGLKDYLYVQDPTELWPTLKELVAKNKRLIVFFNKSFDSKKYPFNAFDDFVFDSAYNFSDVSQLKADDGTKKQPSAEWLKKPNKVFALQHFITETTGGSLIKAPDANKKAVIVDRAQRYMKQGLPLPNFIWVDFDFNAALTEAQKKIISTVPMLLSLDQLLKGNWPTVNQTQLPTQTDVFDAVDALNNLPLSAAAVK
jgi:hypothetical protein